MVAKIVRTAATKVPWRVLIETGLPVAVDEIKKLLAKIGSPKSPDAEKVEDELQQTVRALRDALTEVSERIQVFGEAAQVLTARVTIALAVSVVSLLLAIGCWLLILFRH
jgi:hypothetical protein